MSLKIGMAGLLKGVAGLIFLASCSAFAQEQPEQVYLKLHRAMLAGNADEVMSYATLAKRAEMKNMPGRDAVIKMMAGLTPKVYTVNSRVFNPDGKTARLIASGMGEFMGSHSMMYGTINFLREEGQWRVEQWEWGNQKPATFPVAKPAVPAAPAAAAPTTPARQAANAPKEESKLARQEARKKAREEADERKIADAKAKAEADQKAYEARWKDCVIMPVMSDDQLRKCGVTIKR